MPECRQSESGLPMTPATAPDCLKSLQFDRLPQSARVAARDDVPGLPPGSHMSSTTLNAIVRYGRNRLQSKARRCTPLSMKRPRNQPSKTLCGCDRVTIAGVQVVGSAVGCNRAHGKTHCGPSARPPQQVPRFLTSLLGVCAARSPPVTCIGGQPRLNRLIMSSQIGTRSSNPSQNVWSRRRSKSASEMPCCSTQVK